MKEKSAKDSPYEPVHDSSGKSSKKSIGCIEEDSAEK